ncbi:hypothetical protein PUN28_009105 [Cardiocondyla obscurior]|uniref:Uncharacterized protein n=1 Tax=Cardiocondyla obscurior TaxID=286306 RepID=A0AAW2FVM1_9HYME
MCNFLSSTPIGWLAKAFTNFCKFSIRLPILFPKQSTANNSCLLEKYICLNGILMFNYRFFYLIHHARQKFLHSNDRNRDCKNVDRKADSFCVLRSRDASIRGSVIAGSVLLAINATPKLRDLFITYLWTPYRCDVCTRRWPSLPDTFKARARGRSTELGCDYL